jgi:hypothetical protein
MHFSTIKNLVIFQIIFSLLVFSCSKTKNDQAEEILVRIGDKTITKNEFINRAEFTIRPNYCNRDNYVHRKIVLNSLVAEKLLAIEAGVDNDLLKNDRFHNYLTGRKEQAMRQYLYSNDFYNNVKLDSSELKKTYKLANRTFKISYLSFKENEKATILKEGKTVQKIFDELSKANKLSQREVKWDDQEHDLVHNTLFTNSVEKDQIIGPLKVGENSQLMIKIDGWTDQLLMSDQDVQNRLSKISKKLTENKANQDYNKFINEIMKGKKVQFERTVFLKLVKLLEPLYLNNKKENTDFFKTNPEQQELQEKIFTTLSSELDQIRGLNFLTLDGDVWTVSDFEKELQVHPLVFREKITKNNFAGQFKLAIVNLIEDKFITKQAYQKEYDQLDVVKKNVNLWKDFLLSSYQKNKYLQSIDRVEDFSSDYFSIIKESLNPFVDDLQKKYNDLIEINTDIFEEIELTRIDMFVLQKNMPFPELVPQFPLITTDHNLDYGKKMQLEN